MATPFKPTEQDLDNAAHLVETAKVYGFDELWITIYDRTTDKWWRVNVSSFEHSETMH